MANLDEDLFQAIESGDKDKMEQLIKQGVDVNAIDKDGWTPLHKACLKRNIEVTKLLILNGADINVKIKMKYFPDMTSLHLALIKGNSELAKLLIDKGADVNVKTVCGMTPLHFATIISRLNLVKHLITNGANVNTIITCGEHKGKSSLDIAKERCNNQIVKLLKDHGAKTGKELQLMKDK